MAVFFFVVGLEIKREVVEGGLSEPRRAALPVAAAVGGMAVPAAIYFAWNAGGEGASGGGIPMATDIAFALGVLALARPRAPHERSPAWCWGRSRPPGPGSARGVSRGRWRSS